MTRKPSLRHGLLLLALGFALAACDKGPPPPALSSARIGSELSGRELDTAPGGRFRLGKESYAELRESRREGDALVARVLVRAIDPQAKTGIQGELELTYREQGGAWTLAGVTPGPLEKLEEHYAARLAELTGFPLHFAANIGDAETVAAQLKQGVSVDLPEEKKASTALMFAAERGFLPIVTQLAAAGASVNYRNRYGFTALHAAASTNRLEVARFLVQKGATVDAPDEAGQTPLGFAAERGHLELVRLLVESGADVNRPGKKGWPPLYAAVSGNFPEVAKFLIGRGAKVNVTTPQGTHSPLLVAAYNNHPDMVRLLLAAGADPTARMSGIHGSHRNQTAIDIARQQGNTAVVELLQKKAGT